MVHRSQKIIKNLTKNDVNFTFYEDFVKCVQVYNDFNNHFKIRELNYFQSVEIIKNIACALHNEIDIGSLVVMYPLRIEYHLSFFIILKELNLGFGDQNKYFYSEVFQKNEWERRYIDYIYQLIAFLKQEIHYPLKPISEVENMSSINLTEYIEIVSKRVENGEFGIFNDLTAFLLEELNA